MTAMCLSSSITRITRERLSSLLLTFPTEEKLAVVDVRDADHIGGHIKSSRHVPSNSLDYNLPDLVRQLKSTEKVVFHCTLSQQRGPSAALKYLRERERLCGKDGTVVAAEAGVKKQEVFVLDGGFSEWQEKYGKDDRLTENYNEELWNEGFVH